MRSMLLGLILPWVFVMVVSENANITVPENTGIKTETMLPPVTNMTTTNNLQKPSFIPYCVTRDVCKPVCDCAVYANCQLLDMKQEIRDRILMALNQARSIQTKGEPQASGMPMLKYDIQLEEISKCWSARCENEHSECFRTPYYNETTQTVSLLPLDLNSELSLEYWDRIIQIWLGKVRRTTAEVVSSLPAGKRGEDVHSYAQILADRILRVGCAFSRSSPPGGTSGLIFVCTFAPRGPRQGEPIYKSGKACATCAEGYQCDYKEPYELLCKDTGMAEAREGEEVEPQREGRSGGAELMEYDGPYSESTETLHKMAGAPQPRSAVSSAAFLIGFESYVLRSLLCLVKFIR